MWDLEDEVKQQLSSFQAQKGSAEHGAVSSHIATDSLTHLVGLGQQSGPRL